MQLLYINSPTDDSSLSSASCDVDQWCCQDQDDGCPQDFLFVRGTTLQDPCAEPAEVLLDPADAPGGLLSHSAGCDVPFELIARAPMPCGITGPVSFMPMASRKLPIAPTIPGLCVMSKRRVRPVRDISDLMFSQRACCGSLVLPRSSSKRACSVASWLLGDVQSEESECWVERGQFAAVSL